MVRTPTASYIFACVYLSLYISVSYKRKHNSASTLMYPNSFIFFFFHFALLLLGLVLFGFFIFCFSPYTDVEVFSLCVI